MQIFSFLCLRICFIRWRINWNLFKFIGPFTVPITSYMKITNPTETKVAYKIKTTAPKKYCVRPNGGVLDRSDDKPFILLFNNQDFIKFMTILTQINLNTVINER